MVITGSGSESRGRFVTDLYSLLFAIPVRWVSSPLSVVYSFDTQRFIPVCNVRFLTFFTFSYRIANFVTTPRDDLKEIAAAGKAM